MAGKRTPGVRLSCANYFDLREAFRLDGKKGWLVAFCVRPLNANSRIDKWLVSDHLAMMKKQPSFVDGCCVLVARGF